MKESVMSGKEKLHNIGFPAFKFPASTVLKIFYG